MTVMATVKGHLVQVNSSQNDFHTLFINNNIIFYKIIEVFRSFDSDCYALIAYYYNIAFCFWCYDREHTQTKVYLVIMFVCLFFSLDNWFLD